MADKRLRVDITAKDRTRAAFSRVQKSLRTLKKSLFNVKALIGAAFGALAIRSLTRFVTKAVDAADTIAKTARAIGITTDKLQELRFAADISGISVETLDSAMLGFSKRVGEARAGTGTLFTILNKTDEALLANVRSAGTVDRAFDLITQAANRMGNEMDKSALLSAAFGRTAGTAFKNLVPDIERLSKQARDLGLVIEGSLLTRAEETKDKLTILGKVLTTKFQTAVLQNAGAIDTLADALIRAINALGTWIGDMGPDANASLESLARRIKTVRKEIEQLRDWTGKGDLRATTVGEGILGEFIVGGDRIDREIDERTRRLDELEALERQARVVAELSKPLPLIEFEPHAVDTLEKIKGINTALEKTPPLMGNWRFEMWKATRAAEAQQVAIRDLSTSIETTLIDSLADLSTGFQSWRDVARAALRDVIRAMLRYITVQSSMGGTGGSSGLGNLISAGIGSMMGPSTTTVPAGMPANFTMMQSGGSLSAGQPAIVGEGGPELFVPQGSGTVVPNHALGGGVTVNQTINLSTGVQATVRAEVMGMLPQIASSTKTAVLSARVRGGAFASAFEG